jgi:hypothetical protein
VLVASIIKAMTGPITEKATTAVTTATTRTTSSF